MGGEKSKLSLLKLILNKDSWRTIAILVSKMMYKSIVILQSALFSLLIILSTYSANAAVIEVDIYGDQSNMGYTLESSSLQWMDFGVNNHLTFAYVLNQLEHGNQFAGWRLPTQNEILEFWYQAVFIDFQDLWVNDSNQSVIYANTANSNRNTVTQVVFDPLYLRLTSLAEVMGWNTPYGSGHGSSAGFFLSEDGRLLHTSYGAQGTSLNVGVAYLGDYVDFFENDAQNSTDIGMSTMLVRSVVEPSTFLIIIFGVMGIFARFRKL
jgi:hypothetical protein